MRRLLLYTTSACHLCDEAAAMLDALPNLPSWQLELVEISESDALIARYGVRIPVLKFDDGEAELGWPFDSEVLVRFLTDHSS